MHESRPHGGGRTRVPALPVLGVSTRGSFPRLTTGLGGMVLSVQGSLHALGRYPHEDHQEKKFERDEIEPSASSSPAAAAAAR